MFEKMAAALQLNKIRRAEEVARYSALSAVRPRSASQQSTSSIASRDSFAVREPVLSTIPQGSEDILRESEDILRESEDIPESGASSEKIFASDEPEPGSSSSQAGSLLKPLSRRESLRSNYTDGSRAPFMKQSKDTQSWSKSAKITLNRWIGNIRLSLGYVVTDTRKHKRSLAIGITTVFLVVCFLSLIQNALQRSAVIFIKLAEEQVGQYDMVFLPQSTFTSSSFFLNYTFMNESLQGSTAMCGTAPRWILPAVLAPVVITTSSGSSASNTTSTPTPTLTPTPNPTIDGLNASLSFPNFTLPRISLGTTSTTNVSVILLVLNTNLESSIGLGSSWTHRALGQGEMHATSSTLRSIGIQPNAGQRVLVTIDFLSYLQSFGDTAGLTLEQLIVNFLLNNLEFSLTDTEIPVALLPDLTGVVVTLPDGTQVDVEDLFSQINSTTVTTGDILDAINNRINGTSDVTAIEFLVRLLLQVNNLLVFQQEYTVVDGIDDPDGKYPPSLGNVVVLEQQWFEQSIKSFIRGLENNLLLSLLGGTQLTTLLKAIENIKLQEYALTVIGLFCNRVAIYTQGTQQQALSLVDATDQIAYQLGVNFAASYSFPVAVGIQATQVISLFLNQIFFAVNGVLVILAVLLIYSLLLSDVEEKTFEYGMLRTLGMRQSILILLLLIQASFFSVPGILLGFLVCFILYVFMDLFVSLFVVIPIDASLNSTAITLGILLGVLMPLAGMILPIRRALTQTLRDALDVYHNMVYDSIVRIQRLESLGVSLTETVIAIFLIVIGFLVYYLAPLAFVYNNLTMFLNILTIILLAMVVGQVLVSQVFDIYIERMIVWFIMWGPDRVLINIVRKNLYAHRSRNRKTGMMFTLCIGFIIFAATMFIQQADSIPQNIEWAAGSDIVIQAPSFATPLPEAELRLYLDSLSANSPQPDPLLTQFSVVLGYTFISFPATSDPIITSSGVSGISTIRGRRIVLQAVEQNFLQVASTDYYFTSEISSTVTFPTVPGTSLVDVVAPLNQTFENTQAYYPSLILEQSNVSVQSNDSSIVEQQTIEIYSEFYPILMSETLRTGAYVDTTTTMQLYLGVNINGQTGVLYYLLKPIAMLNKIPAFTNINRLTTSGSGVIVSMDTMYRILNDAYNLYPNATYVANVQVPPKASLLIKVTSNATLQQIEGVINGLNALTTNITNLVLINLKFQVSQTALASQIILLFFDVVAIIGIIFCFFVLWLSFTSNVRENSWEFGVLRAIGIDAAKVMRLYIYEALSLVLTCLFLGTILGLITAIVLTLQLNLFSQNPFSFDFPLSLYIFVAILSLGVAVLGSYFPASELQQKEVALALKGA